MMEEQQRSAHRNMKPESHRKNLKFESLETGNNVNCKSIDLKKPLNPQAAKSSVAQFYPKQIVWAKVKGYPWWPAEVRISLITMSFQITKLPQSVEENYFKVSFIGENNQYFLSKLRAHLQPKSVRKYQMFYEELKQKKCTELQTAIELADQEYSKRLKKKMEAQSKLEEGKAKINQTNLEDKQEVIQLEKEALCNLDNEKVENFQRKVPRKIVRKGKKTRGNKETMKQKPISKKDSCVSSGKFSALSHRKPQINANMWKSFQSSESAFQDSQNLEENQNLRRSGAFTKRLNSRYKGNKYFSKDNQIFSEQLLMDAQGQNGLALKGHQQSYGGQQGDGFSESNSGENQQNMLSDREQSKIDRIFIQLLRSKNKENEARNNFYLMNVNRPLIDSIEEKLMFYISKFNQKYDNLKKIKNQVNQQQSLGGMKGQGQNDQINNSAELEASLRKLQDVAKQSLAFCLSLQNQYESNYLQCEKEFVRRQNERQKQAQSQVGVQRPKRISYQNRSNQNILIEDGESVSGRDQESESKLESESNSGRSVDEENKDMNGHRRGSLENYRRDSMLTDRQQLEHRQSMASLSAEDPSIGLNFCNKRDFLLPHEILQSKITNMLSFLVEKYRNNSNLLSSQSQLSKLQEFVRKMKHDVLGYLTDSSYYNGYLQIIAAYGQKIDSISSQQQHNAGDSNNFGEMLNESGNNIQSEEEKHNLKAIQGINKEQIIQKENLPNDGGDQFKGKDLSCGLHILENEQNQINDSQKIQTKKQTRSEMATHNNKSKDRSDHQIQEKPNPVRTLRNNQKSIEPNSLGLSGQQCSLNQEKSVKQKNLMPTVVKQDKLSKKNSDSIDEVIYRKTRSSHKLNPITEISHVEKNIGSQTELKKQVARVSSEKNSGISQKIQTTDKSSGDNSVKRKVLRSSQVQRKAEQNDDNNFEKDNSVEKVGISGTRRTSLVPQIAKRTEKEKNESGRNKSTKKNLKSKRIYKQLL